MNDVEISHLIKIYKLVDITLNETVTTLSDDGGAYSGISGGRGGFGGGRRE